MTKTTKIAQIGPYPPPSGGWSFRIQLLKQGINQRDNCDCKVLNIGKSRKIKSDEYLDVQNGVDYLFKLLWLRLRGYEFHLHANAQAVKGPLLVLTAHIISILTFSRAAMTFHGGYIQLYYPKKNAGTMYPVIYLNFLLSKLIICNDINIKKEISAYGWNIRNEKIYPIPAFSKQYISLDKSPLPDDILEYISTKNKIITCYASYRHGYYLETLCEFVEQLPKDIGLVITGAGTIEDDHILPYANRLKQFATDGKIVIKDAIEHSQFVTLIEKSNLFLRTYISDGVASSVLESLMIGTVVVASDNGQRPEGVVTYTVDDISDLTQKVFDVIENQAYYEERIKPPLIKDTVKEEIDLLEKRLK